MDHLTRRAVLAAVGFALVALALAGSAWFEGSRAGVQSTASLRNALACVDGACVVAPLEFPFGPDVESPNARVRPDTSPDAAEDSTIVVDPGWSAFAGAAGYTRPLLWVALALLGLFLLAVAVRARGLLHAARNIYRPTMVTTGVLSTVALVGLLMAAPADMSASLSPWLALVGATCTWLCALPSALFGERTDVDFIRVTAPPPIAGGATAPPPTDTSSLPNKPIASASDSLTGLGETRHRRNTLPEKFVAAAAAAGKPGPAGGAVRRRQIRNTGTVGTTPVAAADALMGALRFCASTCEIVRDGIRWTQPDGEQRSLVWADVSFVAARLLPAEPPYDRTLVVDVALDFGSPLRLLPSTRVNYNDLPGGASPSSRDNLRRLGAFIVAQNPGARLERDSVDFFDNSRAPRAYLAISQFEAWDQQYS